MTAAWKQVLYDYVRHANQRDMDYTIKAFEPNILDAAFLKEQQRRLDRIQKWHETRGVRPAESETTLRLLSVKEQERRVTADIVMQVKQRLRSGHEEHEEQIAHRERIVLSEHKGRWLVERIEPLMPERAPSIYENSFNRNVQHKEVRLASTPFLSPGVTPAWDVPRSFYYDRQRAAAYADRFWNEPNPNYIYFDVDCTNYVSQCVFAGGILMNYTGKRESGWWFHGRHGGRELWSYSWAVAHSLQSYLSSGSNHAGIRMVSSPYQLSLGDVICYDFDGDGKFQHNTIVTGFDPIGRPLVNAHTVNSRHRYWDYRDSYAWTERTEYRFFHIPDRM